jgi:hypothetical protein
MILLVLKKLPLEHQRKRQFEPKFELRTLARSHGESYNEEALRGGGQRGRNLDAERRPMAVIKLFHYRQLLRRVSTDLAAM